MMIVLILAGSAYLWWTKHPVQLPGILSASFLALLQSWITVGFIRWDQRCAWLLSRAEPMRLRFKIRFSSFPREMYLVFTDNPPAITERLRKNVPDSSTKYKPDKFDSLIESIVYFEPATLRPIAFDCGPVLSYVRRWKEQQTYIWAWWTPVDKTTG